MVIERENLEQTPEVSDERIAGVVMKVLEKVKEEGKEQSHLEAINKDLGFLKKVICDEQGVCRLITKEEFTKTKDQADKEERKKETLPHMSTTIRQGMTEDQNEERDLKFALKMKEVGGTFGDSFRYIVNDPDSREGLIKKVLLLMKPEDTQKHIENCVIGPDGELVCGGLRSRGIRIQKQDSETKEWNTFGVPEQEGNEQKKKELSHF